MQLNIFDVDKTLYDGYLIVDFAEFLARKNAFNRQALKVIRKELQKFRQGQDYFISAKNILQAYAHGIKGQKTTTINKLAREFVKKNEKKFFRLNKTVIAKISKKGRSVAISISPIEIISVLKTKFGLNAIYGTEYKTHNKTYTGEIVDDNIIEFKKRKIQESKKRFKARKNETKFFGDSLEDFKAAEKTGIEFIAINPQRELKHLIETTGIESFPSILEYLKSFLRKKHSEKIEKRKAYYKNLGSGKKIPRDAPPTIQAGGIVLYAKHNGKIYILLADRQHTFKWLGRSIIGSAGKQNPGEPLAKTALREFKEELGLNPEIIKQLIPIGTVKAQEINPKELHHGISAVFYLGQVSIQDLKKIKQHIKKNQNTEGFELKNARIIRLTHLGTQFPKLVPHYKKFFPQLRKAIEMHVKPARQKQNRGLRK